MPADVLCATVFEPPNYAVPGYIIEGLTLLAGKPKIGKSWLMLHVGIAVACGSFTLDDIHCVKGDVLYAALEDNKRRLQRRLRKLLNGRPAPEATAGSKRRRNAAAERGRDGDDPGLDRAGAGAEAGRRRRAGQGARPTPEGPGALRQRLRRDGGTQEDRRRVWHRHRRHPPPAEDGRRRSARPGQRHDRAVRLGGHRAGAQPDPAPAPPCTAAAATSRTSRRRSSSTREPAHGRCSAGRQRPIFGRTGGRPCCAAGCGRSRCRRRTSRRRPG